MALLKVENNFSWLQTDDDDLKERFWRALRFRDPSCFFNPRYKAKRWDGYHEFFKRNTGRFLTGLLPEITRGLRHLKQPYQVQDRRGGFKFAVDKIDEHFVPGMTLRDYQVENVNMTISNHRGLVYAPTSAGKTAILQGISLACPKDAQILILGGKKGLVDQNSDALAEVGLDGIGRLYNGVYKHGRAMCATWQSCHKIADWLPSVQVLLVDEVHSMMASGSKQVYRLLDKAAVRIGFSATPFKNGGRDPIQKYDVKGWMGAEFEIESVEDGRLTTKQLQKRGLVSTCDCTFFNIREPDLGPYVLYPDAVTRGIAENAYFHDIVARIAKSRPGRTLIIVERIAHGDMLLDRIPNALWVRGQDNMKTRKEVIRRLKEDTDDVVAIATAGIFNDGINCFIHTLINAAGGKADHTIIQRFGRGLRLAKDKDHLQYYDFLFRINDYLEDHSEHRVKVLEAEGHAVTQREIDF